MKNLILPNTFVYEINEPLIFLAGPIRSAPNWHDEAIEYLFSKRSNLAIASPRKEVREEFASYVVSGIGPFSRQRIWERNYIDIAKQTGCVMFWLPGEEKHSCDKVYGAMSRFELGQLFTYFKLDNSTRFCIGSDGNFPELHTIECDLKLDAPNKQIFSSLEKTCDEALRITSLT